MSQRLSALILLAACGKAADKAPPSTAGSDKPPPVAAQPAPAKPQAKDPTVKDMLAKGTSCELQQGGLPLACPELKAIGDYAFQHQGSTEAAETCAAFLGDPDNKKRLLAAECLFHFNAVGKTPELGFALDAIETEKEPKTLEEIAWGISGAEAVTAKLDDRVLTVSQKLMADPKTDTAAGYLFGTLFPQYMMGSGPKPPIKAQTLAIASLTRDGTGMQREAFNAVKMLDDKAAVCTALDSDLRVDAKRWADAADAIVAMKDACVANLAKTIDFTLARLAAGDAHLELLRRFDSVFDLDAPTRAKIQKAVRAARAKAEDWQRKDFDATADQFSKPPKPRK